MLRSSANTILANVFAAPAPSAAEAEPSGGRRKKGSGTAEGGDGGDADRADGAADTGEADGGGTDAADSERAVVVAGFDSR